MFRRSPETVVHEDLRVQGAGEFKPDSSKLARPSADRLSVELGASRSGDRRTGEQGGVFETSTTSGEVCDSVEYIFNPLTYRYI